MTVYDLLKTISSLDMEIDFFYEITRYIKIHKVKKDQVFMELWERNIDGDMDFIDRWYYINDCTERNAKQNGTIDLERREITKEQVFRTIFKWDK